MSDVSKYVAEWTKVGKRVIVLPTGEEGEITGFYGMQYRLVRVGDTRTPLVVDLTDLGPSDQQSGRVSRVDAVSRETKSHVQHDSMPVETLRSCADIPPDQFREHWLEQTGNHAGAAPLVDTIPATIHRMRNPRAGESFTEFKARCIAENAAMDAPKDPLRAPWPGESLRDFEDRMIEMNMAEQGLDRCRMRFDTTAVFAGAPHIPEEGKPTNPKDAIATDKLPLHLLSPFVKAYQAIAHYLGNVKYGAWNWRAAGIRLSVYKAAHDRHMDAFWEGEFYDPVDGTPHLANAQCCLNILIDAWCTGNVIDDRPPSNPERLAKVRAELEALMPKIRAKYADKHPRHFTIADTDELKRPHVAQPQGDVR